MHSQASGSDYRGPGILSLGFRRRAKSYYHGGRPSVPENYNLYNVDRVNVYVFKAAMVAPEGISITKSKHRDSEVNIQGLIYDKEMSVIQ